MSVSIGLQETSKVCEVRTRSKSTKDCDTVCREGFSFSEITHTKSDLRKKCKNKIKILNHYINDQ